MENRSDTDIIKSVQAGYISDFELLVKRYERRLILYAYKLGSSHHDAYDIVQNTFLNVYKHIGNIDTKRKFSSYIFTILKHEYITQWRTRQSTIPLEKISEMANEDDVWADLENEERKNLVLHAVNTLPHAYKTILRLYYFSQLTYKEIAGRISIPVNTVRTRLRRAKIAFGKTYEKQKQ